MTADVYVEARQETVVARLRGDVDMAAAPVIEARVLSAVEDAPPRCLIVDLSAVDYVDSSGIELLFRLHRVIDPGTTALLAVAPEGSVAARLFDLVVLDAVADVCRTLDEALTRCVAAS